MLVPPDHYKHHKCHLGHLGLQLVAIVVARNLNMLSEGNHDNTL